jgi:triphosphoribosyl-dephospho-CoA synthase
MISFSRLAPAEQGRITDDRSLRLATLAMQALIDEAELTPKPALVDRLGTGAHTDLSLELMKRSARNLRESFELMANVSYRHTPNQNLREELGRVGRLAENSMLSVTGGVNTHRGAIWSLGLLVSAAAMGTGSLNKIMNLAGQLARIPDRQAPKANSNGSRAIRRYQVCGAQGEARSGFPHVRNSGLPVLDRSRQQGFGEAIARLNALLAIMVSLNDTCLLHRGGLAALTTAQVGATAVLAAGGAGAARGWKRLQRLGNDLMTLNASPGGSADLLAATLFLDSVRSAY